MDDMSMTLGLVLYIAVIAVMIAAQWKVYTKAGEPGWACIVPVFNLYILLQIVGRPWWWLLLLLVPIVNFFIVIIVYMDLAKSFGRGLGFSLGLLLLPVIFFPILGFGDDEYQGPAALAQA
jgi:hypothetical protein